MSSLCRVGQSKLKILSTQFFRCYIRLPHASSTFNSTIAHRKLSAAETQHWTLHRRPSDICNNVRFFAAPFQAKQKTEADTDGPRLNEEITAQFVRLVMDDGHSIVPRLSALEWARELKLDLVEVQKNAKPPVCKIMDFHKEQYKRQTKEKDRAKSKSELTLRQGDYKEVRFSAKTELKDLKMKADNVKRFMDKGHRVKCRALGTEDQDLTGLLSRLSALIQDVTVVESGPHLGKKEAYMLVRHVKYGPPKKGGGGGKKLQDAVQMTANVQNHSSAESEFETEGEEVLSDGVEDMPLSMNTSAKNVNDKSNAWSVFDQNGDFDKVFDLNDNLKRATTAENQANTASKAASMSKYACSAEVHDSCMENMVSSTPPQPPAVTENRYKRAEPSNRFQPGRSDYNTGVNNRGSEIRHSVRSGPPILNQKRPDMLDMNDHFKIESSRPVRTAPSGSRSSMPHPSAPNAPRSGYGIFSSPKSCETQGVNAGMHGNREANSRDHA